MSWVTIKGIHRDGGQIQIFETSRLFSDIPRVGESLVIDEYEGPIRSVRVREVVHHTDNDKETEVWIDWVAQPVEAVADLFAFMEDNP